MPYEAAIIQTASARLERRREQRDRARYKLERALYDQAPRLREIDTALRGTMAELAMLAAGPRPVAADGPEIAAIRARNGQLQAERARLLEALGYGPGALDDAPACPLCGDTGWAEGHMCACLRQLCAQEQLKALTDAMHLTEEQDFDRLRLDIYSDQPWNGGRSPRETMRRVIAVCGSYARQFPDFESKNLLLSGNTGLGKTYLSGCIAREVSQRGYSVVYDTAIHLFTAFETRRFTRDAGEERQARDDTRRYLGCDLLILDDLGSELTTPLSQSSLYEVVNSRLQSGRHTILSTNLSMDHIAQRYTPQLASRIGGLYQELTFYGDDLRLLRSL